MQLFHLPHNLMERKVHIDVIFFELFLIGLPLIGVAGVQLLGPTRLGLAIASVFK
jgi:hypothetical protein